MSSNSTTVDNRIVEMQFNNAQFENGVRESMSTLDKLKKALNMDSAKKGFDELDKASKNVKFDGISAGLETTKQHFSAMEVVGITALANITTAAMRAGANIVKSLTIDQVTSGFGEYELKMGSIQTIMAGTGESLETVTKYLNDLNTYSDKTIYSFSDMTQNIGKFTNAGVKLEDAVNAIKGIANEAAVSGANAQEASRAMYNFAQALSAGYVKLIDWKSIENANMATVEFKQHLIDTAVACGTLQKSSDGMYQAGKKTLNATKNFNETLEQGWMTTEVLTKTLQEYADESTGIGKKATEAATKVRKFTQLMDTLKEAVGSGWAQSFELIVGDFNEATDVFTGVSDVLGDVIGKIADSRNAFLQTAFSSSFKKLTVYMNGAGVSTDEFKDKIEELAVKTGITKEKIEELGGVEKAIKKGIIPKSIVKQAIDSLLNIKGPATDAKKAYDAVTESTKNFNKTIDEVIGGKWGRSQERWDKLAKAGYNWAEVQNKVNEKLGSSVQHEVKLNEEQLKNVGVTEEQAKAYVELQKQAEANGETIEELLNSLEKPSGRELVIDTISNVWKGLTRSLGAVRDAWAETMGVMKGYELYGILEAIFNFSKHLAITEKEAGKLKNAFKGVFAIFNAVRKVIKAGINATFKVLSALLGGVGDDALSVADALGQGAVKMVEFLKPAETLTDIIGEVAEAIANAIKHLKNWLKANVDFTEAGKGFLEFCDGVWEALTTIAEKFQILERAEKAGKAVTGGLAAAFSKIKEAMPGLKTGMSDFVDSLKNMDSNSSGVSKVGGIFNSFYDNVIAKIPKISSVIGAVKDSFSSFSEGVSSAVSNVNEKIKGAESTISGLIENIKGNADENSISHLIGAGIGLVLMKMIFMVAKLFDAIGGIGEAMEDIAQGFGKTLAGLGKILKAFSLQVKAKALKTVAEAILILVASLAVLTLLAKWDLSSLGVACAILAGLVLAIVGLAFAMSKLSTIDLSGMVGAAGIILAMSVAVGVLALALKALVGCKFSDVWQPLVMLGLMLAAITAACIAIGKFAPDIGKGAAIILSFAVAVKILISAIKDFSNIDMSKVGAKHWVALAGFFVGLAMLMAVCWDSGATAMKGAAGLLLIGVALKLMINVLKSYMELDLKEIKMENLAFMAVLIVALCKVLGAAKKAGPQAMAGAAGLVIIGVALRVMVSVIKALSDLSPGDILQGTVAVIAMGAMISVLLAIMMTTSKNAKPSSILASATAMLVLSGAMLILTLSVIALGELQWEKALQGVLAVSALILMLNTMLKASKDSMANWKTIMGLALCVGVLAVALTALSFIPATELWNAVGALSSVMALMTVMMVIGRHMDTEVKAIAALIVAVGVLAGALCALALTADPTKLAIATASLSIVMGVLIAMMAVSKFARGGFKSMGALMGAVAVLATSIGILAQVDTRGIIKASIALGIVMGMMTALLAVSQFAKGSWATILSLSAMIAVVGGIMSALAAIDGGDGSAVNAGIGLAIALGAITVALIALAAASVLLGSAVGGVLAFSAAVVLLGLGILSAGAGISMLSEGLTKLADLFANRAGDVAGGIDILIDSITTAIPKIFEAILSAFVDGIPAMVDGVMQFISSILESLATRTPEIIGYFVDFIVAIINGIAEAIPKIAGAIGNVINAIIGVAKEAIGNVSIEQFAELALGMGALAALVFIFSTIAPMVPSALLGAAGAMLMVAEMGLLLAAIGKLSEIPGLTWLIEESATFAQAVGNAIGSFVGGIVNGFANAATENLPDIGAKLSSFMLNLTPFLDGLRTIDSGMLDSILVLSAMIITLTAAELLDGIASFITGSSSIDDFGEKIKTFGKAMVEFSSIVSGNIDSAAVTAAANAGKTMAEMADIIPNTGGVAGFFAGDNDINDFGAKMLAFGGSMVQFSRIVSGNIDSAAVTAAANAGKTMAEMADIVPNTGGVVDFFAGSNDVDVFGKKLESFGSSMVAFSSTVADKIDDKAVTAAANAGKTMAEMADIIPNTGGVADFFAGSNDVDVFGKKLESFGSSMVAFSNALLADGGINEEAVIAAATAGKMFAEMASAVPKSGGIGSIFAGDNNIEDFGENLVGFGEGLKGLSDAISGENAINITAVRTAVDAGLILANMSTKVSDNGLATNILGKLSKSEFVNSLSALGEGMKSFSDKSNGIAIANVQAGATAVKIFSENFPAKTDFKSMLSGDNNMSSFGEQLKTFGASLADFYGSTKNINSDKLGKISGAIGKISEAFAKNKNSTIKEFDGLLGDISKSVAKSDTDFEKEGKGLIRALNKGINSEKNNSISEIKTMVDNGKTSVRNKYTDYKYAGQYLIDGFTQGLKDKRQDVALVVTSIGKSALESMKESLDERSPSKATREMGRYFDEGFVNGVSDYAHKVLDSTAGLGKSSLNVMKSAINKVSSVVQNGIDATPTIRPVMDLSDVKSGIGLMNGLFGDEYSVGANATINSVGATMRNKYANSSSNDDIVRAIDRLDRSLRNVQPNVTNINGITYDDGSNIHNMIGEIVHAAKIERRM